MNGTGCHCRMKRAVDWVGGLCSRLGGLVGNEVSGEYWGALWEVGGQCGTLL